MGEENFSDRHKLGFISTTGTDWDYLSRPAALVTAFTMVVAIFAVHFEHGLFLANGGYEFGLALLAASVALFFYGGGKFSADGALTKK